MAGADILWGLCLYRDFECRVARLTLGLDWRCQIRGLTFVVLRGGGALRELVRMFGQESAEVA